MALKYQIESLDGIDDALAAHYSKDEESGQFVLSLELPERYEVADNTGLKTAHEKTTAKLRAAKEELEAAKAEVEDLTKKANQKPSKGEEADAARLAQQVEALQSEIAAKDERILQLDGDVSKYVVENEARKALEAGGFRSAADVLLPHVLPTLRAGRDPESGHPHVEVVNGTGERRVGGADGSFMTVEQRIAELHKDPTFSRFADGTELSGTNQRGGGAESPVPASNQHKGTPQERLEAYYANGAA